MKYDRIECKTLAVVDDEGLERIRLSTDDNGGRVDIIGPVKSDQPEYGFSLSFDLTVPSFQIISKDHGGITISVIPGGAFINLIGSDGKVKASLSAEETGGLLMTGDDVLNTTLT